MDSPDVEELKRRTDDIKAKMSALKTETNKLLFSGYVKFALKLYLGIAATVIVGAVIFKPVFKVAGWLWNLY